MIFAEVFSILSPMKRTIKTAIFLWLFLPIFAATLRVAFVDEYGNPLPGVRLRLYGEKNLTFFAGESGVIVAELPPGKYRIVAKLKGFCSREGEALVLPGVVNSYTVSLKLGVEKCPPGARRLPAGEEFWPAEGFSPRETLSQSRETLEDKSERFFVNGREFSQGHFTFSLTEPAPFLGSYLALSRDRGSVEEERPGKHSYFYSPGGIYLGFEMLPSSLSSGQYAHGFTNALVSGSVESSGYKGSFSLLYAKENREFPGAGEFTREFYSGYFSLAKGDWGASAMVSRRREPHQWGKEMPWLPRENVPSLDLRQRDFFLYYGKRLNSPFGFSAGVETKEAEENTVSLYPEVNLSSGWFSYFLNKNTRLRRYHFGFDGRLFFDRLAGAQHYINYGGDFEYMTLREIRKSQEPVLKFSSSGGEVYPGAGFYWWRIYPYGNEEQSGKFYHISLRVQDVWNFGRLNLFTGVRYDSYHSGFNSGIKSGLEKWGFLNGQGNEDVFSRRLIYSFNGVSTEGFGIRLGFTYEIFKGLYMQGGVSRFARPIDVEDMEIYYPLFQGWADVFWRDLNGDGSLSPDEVLKKRILPPASPSSTFPTEFTDVISLGLSGESGGVFYGAQFWLENYSNRAAIINTKISSNKESDWWQGETIQEPGPDGIFGTGDDGEFVFYYFVPTEKVSEFSWAFSPYPVKDLSAVSRNFRVFLRKYLTGRFSFFLEGIYSQKRGYWGPSYPRIYSPNQLQNIKGSFNTLYLAALITLSPVKNLYFSALYNYRSGKPLYRWIYFISEKSPPFNLEKILLSAPGYELSDPIHNLNLSLSYSLGNVTLYLRINNALGGRVEVPLRGFQGLLTEDGKFFPSSSFFPPYRTYGEREVILGLRFNY